MTTERISVGYYKMADLANEMNTLGDIHTPDGKIISREEQTIEELKALGYQFLYYPQGFVIIVTVPKNIKYDKNRKYVEKDPMGLRDAKYNFLKRTIESYETRTAKYNCRKIHSKRLKMFTRGGYFLTDFLNAVTALEDTVNLAIDEYKGGATNESI